MGSKIKYFFTNPFWRSIPVVILLVLAIVLNCLIWFFYSRYGRDMMSVVSVGYSSGVVILNLFLGNLVYDKEEIISLIIVGIAVLIQIAFLVFLKLFALP